MNRPFSSQRQLWQQCHDELPVSHPTAPPMDLLWHYLRHDRCPVCGHGGLVSGDWDRIVCRAGCGFLSVMRPMGVASDYAWLWVVQLPPDMVLAFSGTHTGGFIAYHVYYSAFLGHDVSAETVLQQLRAGFLQVATLEGDPLRLRPFSELGTALNAFS